MGIFVEGEETHSDHGLGSLVEFRFKAPPGITSSSITNHTPSGQRNCVSWASQPQKSVTLLPCPGGKTTKSTKDMWWHWTKKNFSIVFPTPKLGELFIFTHVRKQFWDTHPKFTRPQCLLLPSVVTLRNLSVFISFDYVETLQQRSFMPVRPSASVPELLKWWDSPRSDACVDYSGGRFVNLLRTESW